MRITDLEFADESIMQQVAQLLVAGFAHMSPHAWPNLRSAQQEVKASLAPERISLVAIDDNDKVLGWISATRQYSGHVWELHPLVVDPQYQYQGIGTALVVALETRVRDSGGLTLWLGTDDVKEQTSLFGKDLYPHLLQEIAGIKNLRGHPFEFYEKLGFTIVGVLPDANGFGKPDIFMAKRVRPIQ